MTIYTNSSKPLKGLPRDWAIWCILNLLIVSFLGLMMRYKIVLPLPFANQAYLLHAHSHFVFCGWVSLTLFCCMVVFILPEQVSSRPAYRYMFWLLEAASIGMLIAFLCQGYGFFSIIGSFLFILIFYWFIVRIWKDYRETRAPGEITWFIKASLIWFVVSSAGFYILGYYSLNTAAGASPMELRAILYFYLHFQYNGWFTFAVFGLLLHWLHRIRFYPGSSGMKAVFWLLTVGVVPGYFLSVIGFYPYWWIQALSAIAVGAHIIAGGILFFIVVKGYGHLGRFIPRETDILWKIATAAYFLKIALQGATIVPSWASFAFSFRPLIIGYLHLVFLCFITFFLMGYLFYHHRLTARETVAGKWGLALFIIFVILNEAVLFGQSFFAYLKIYFGFFNTLLLVVTAGIFVGLLLFLAGQRVRTPRNNK